MLKALFELANVNVKGISLKHQSSEKFKKNIRNKVGSAFAN